MLDSRSPLHYTNHMLRSLIVLVILVVIGLCLLALEGMLLTEEMDAHVHHFVKSANSLAYIVPESGGEIDTCPIEDDKLWALQQGAEIVVKKTLILGRCVSIKPIRCVGYMCSSGTNDVINADHFIQNVIRYAYRNKYANLGELRKEYPGFSPQIKRWPIIRIFWSPVRYSVRLPEKLVILDRDGKIWTTRECGSAEGYCQKILPGQVEITDDTSLSGSERK